MHSNDNTEFLTDRKRIQNAVPFMVLALMLHNAIKRMEGQKKEDGEKMLTIVHQHVKSLIISETLERRADRAYQEIVEWMVKSRFTVRKGIFVIMQFTALLTEYGFIKLDKGTVLHEGMCTLFEIYEASLADEPQENLEKFERSGLKAVFDLGIRMQRLGYFQEISFKKGDAA